MKRFLSLRRLLGASVLSFACADPAPLAPLPARPDRQIADGANGGNAHFFFLAPLVAGTPAFTGQSDGNVSASVDICDVGAELATSASGCVGDAVATFSTTGGTGGELVRYDPPSEQYILNWHTTETSVPLVTGHYYRISVRVLGTLLGFADVAPLANASEMKNARTGGIITLVNGRTLPIKFRIEKGAVYVIEPPVAGAPPAQVTSVDGSVTLTVPYGALGEPVAITITETNSPPGTPSSDVVGGSTWEFGPDGLTFDEPVHVSVSFNTSEIPAGRQLQSLRLVTLVDDRWRPVEGSTVNAATNTVSASLQHFSTYSIASMHQLALTFYNPSAPTNDKMEIWLAYEDGSGLQRLAYGRSPSWSPDGTKLAFVVWWGCTSDPGCGESGTMDHREDDDVGVAVIDAANPSSLTLLPDTRYANARSGAPLAWSPDGQWIALEDWYHLVFARADGSGNIRNNLPHIPLPCQEDKYDGCGQWVSYPSWSGDGSRIVFARSIVATEQGWIQNTPTRARIYSIASMTGSISEQLVTLPPNVDTWPVPGTFDGQRLLISTTPFFGPWYAGGWYTTDLKWYNVSTGNVTTLVDGLYAWNGGIGIPPHYDWYIDSPHAQLTPDGTRVYFFSYGTTQADYAGIWTVELDGSHLTKVIDGETIIQAAGLPSNAFLRETASWRR
jgi:hypothetical protein